MRKEFPRSVKVAAVKRATVNGEIYCEECGVICKSKWEIDHVRADALLGEPTLENARVLCNECHKEKTKSDVGKISKAKRIEARNLGIKRNSGFHGGSRGFPTSNKTKLPLTKVMPRKPMFIDGE